MKPVMLALSTFRQSDKAIQLAIEKAKINKNLVIVFIIDKNLARYFIGTDIGLFPDLKDKCEHEILKENVDKANKKAKSIVLIAQNYGISVRTYMEIGRFALKTLEIIKKENPELIITTRSNRPKWVKKLFGSPVNYLITNTNCEVIDV